MDMEAQSADPNACSSLFHRGVLFTRRSKNEKFLFVLPFMDVHVWLIDNVRLGDGNMMRTIDPNKILIVFFPYNFSPDVIITRVYLSHLGSSLLDALPTVPLLNRSWMWQKSYRHRSFQNCLQDRNFFVWKLSGLQRADTGQVFRPYNFFSSPYSRAHYPKEYP